MKIMTVFGTRPEAIKMAPVVKQLQSQADIESFCCVTGQHRELLQQVLDIFDIVPDVNLDVMQPNQNLSELSSKILLGVSGAIAKFNPDLVLVHGDTTTTFMATLSAFYAQVPVGHVEAGLRTGNLSSPWPEEANRKLTGAIARFHFAPTEFAADNLRREGVDPATILMTGNTVIDALQLAIKKIDATPAIREKTLQDMPFLTKAGRKILVTGHRRENFGKPFENICNALRTTASDWPDVDIIYPMHLNPNVREPVLRLLSDKPNIHLLPPLEYLTFIDVMRQMDLIVTDSGGLQEEGAALRKPVLVMRDTTERGEAVATGAVRLIGTEEGTIAAGIKTLLENPDQLTAMQNAKNPFGDGTAAQKIVKFIQANIKT